MTASRSSSQQTILASEVVNDSPVPGSYVTDALAYLYGPLRVYTLAVSWPQIAALAGDAGVIAVPGAAPPAPSIVVATRFHLVDTFADGGPGTLVARIGHDGDDAYAILAYDLTTAPESRVEPLFREGPITPFTVLFETDALLGGFLNGDCVFQIFTAQYRAATP